ncbi:hypothetical protein S7711_01440 [Stachybotrys chartarum IBT 7711]|uniref:SPX domain-containing protein n=1 Tax=Stachybotrys chartarum (strain CBS 109288 / IBT 7711) TaxID=1280523 RepID=A0A084B6Z5_STACB|nr:hypothetical protein S7711_01440 [Stachybotrys chartarum IBT 7711]KFA55084.1 hypothetical protein S40293_03538 [Stachybotrys chartarum IBT 40293]KFA77827.1 hypothetical protein S40288_00436 [Stachybotrys chartarum IBT 40288]
MKFAKELERDAVPEWRVKYLNYKAGKKYVKSVSRALTRASATPRSFGARTPSLFPGEYSRPPLDEDKTPTGNGVSRSKGKDPQWGPGRTILATPSLPVPAHPGHEDQALTSDGKGMQYGSFVATPPTPSPLRSKQSQSTFELPGPAMGPSPDLDDDYKASNPNRGNLGGLSAARRSRTLIDAPNSSGAHFRNSGDLARRPSAGPVAGEGRLRSFLSHTAAGITSSPRNDIQMRNKFDLVREREREFYEFLDSELDKVETFYMLKEQQAGQRLAVLREQLHEMRNRRMQEIHDGRHQDDDNTHEEGRERSQDKLTKWVQPLKAKVFPPGPNSQAFRDMPQTPHVGAQCGDAARDYIRRPEKSEVSYRTAKRKLKLALQEFYRSLELLKSYALLNRTAFRKLNKKYDKAVHARPAYRYTNEKVNKAWFVNSEVLEGHIRTVEDLYARYFERGNHKLAVGKLRSLAQRARDEAGSSFLNGFLIGTGLVFGVQGLVSAAELLWSNDADVRQQTSYLLQIYGGYFFMLLIFAAICINCFVWSQNKVNYPFIFEFDQRHLEDWRRIAEFPSLFLFLQGLIVWMNFSPYRSEDFFLYYPIVLIALSVIIIFLPAPVLAHRSRRWFINSHGRLLLAGALPVEFRDFFLGDMYCSLTYATANAELFFCLYANEWDNPVQCNSNHSRVLGFLTALPPIIRFCQCIRRYKDTRNIFPHLVNCGKYTMSIMSAVTLSLYRIDGTRVNLGLFIAFSTINGIYCSIWDLFMDFSLLQPHSRNFCLRDILALKAQWPYYAIMAVDPILRFSWIFYAIFTHDVQHSTMVSFLVALTEVLRRSVWALLRVENEHCANVAQYKASRDVPLPYRIEPLSTDRVSAETSPMLESQEQRDQYKQQRGDAADEVSGGVGASSTAVASTLGTVRRRVETPSGRSLSKILAEAHKQDFEKKRKPIEQDAQLEQARNPSDDDDDDDDDDGTDEEQDPEAL